MNDLTITEPINVDVIRSRIITIRDVQVMLDRDLAELYGVEVGQLNRQVKRNIERFPHDFMFQLSREDCSRCQIGTLNGGRGSNDLCDVFFMESSPLAALHRRHHKQKFKIRPRPFCRHVISLL